MVIPGITPVTKPMEVSFSESVGGEVDLSNKVIDNTYFNMNVANGDGYSSTEQALILNSTTTAEQMNTIQNAEVGENSIRNNYNGIIFEVPKGKGTITVDTKTIGNHVLNLQIGNGSPTKITKSERGTIDVLYNVTEPTYIYLYASSEDGSAARSGRASAAANSVLLYGYKVVIGNDIAPGDANADGEINVTDIVMMVNIIMSSGSRFDEQEVKAILKDYGFIFKGE